MHGVHPKPNAIPTITAPKSVFGFEPARRRASVSRNGILNTPIVCRPMTITSAPAIFSKRLLLRKRNRPMTLADAPRAMNTSEKPSTKASDVMST